MIKTSAVVHISDDRIVVQRRGSTANRFTATQRNLARIARFDTGKTRVYPAYTVIVIRASL